MENPNEYDDAQYLRAIFRLEEVVGEFWEAGAEVDNIRDEFENVLENVTGEAA